MCDKCGCGYDGPSREEETLDIRANFGDPSGGKYRGCLDQLFDGNGFQIEEEGSSVDDVDDTYLTSRLYE